MELEIVYFLARIIFGGILCFLAILLLSRNRDSEWINMVMTCLSSYFFTVLDLLIQYGLLNFNHEIFDIVFEIGKIAVPSTFMIITFVIKLIKSKKI